MLGKKVYFLLLESPVWSRQFSGQHSLYLIMLPSQQVASGIAKAKDKRSGFYAMVQKKHVSLHLFHWLWLVTWLSLRELGSVDFVCVQKGEKNGVGEHCIPLLHIGSCDILLEWNLGNRVWYYEYLAGDSKFPGTQVWATAFFLATATTCKPGSPGSHIGR